MKKHLLIFAAAASTAVAFADAPGVATRVVVEKPGASPISSVKEGSELIFVNNDGSFAAPMSKAPASHRVVAEPMDPPFVCNFSNATDLDLFTVVNANNDGANCTWAMYNGFVAVQFNQWQAANDYLISPPLNLKANCMYTFTTAARPYQDNYDERLEMWVGTAPTADGMTTCLMESKQFTELKFVDASADFVPQEDGVYYFAIRAVSPADQYAICVNKFEVSAGSSILVPGRPDLSFIRDPEGREQITLAVTAPTLNSKGEEVGALTSMNIYRDDELITTIEDVTPGSKYEYLDDKAECGLHTYAVSCSNEYGEGPKVTDQTFVGIYYAVWPEKVTPSVGENEGQVELNWTPCTVDQLGNPLPEGSVTYNIYRIHNGNVGLYAEGVKEPHFVDQVCGADEPMREVQYTIMSVTSYGMSAGTGSGVFYAGAPYEPPYTESITDGKIGSLLYTRGLANYASGWDIADMADYDVSVPTDGSDEDGGFLYHYAYRAGEVAEIGTAKIHIPANSESASLTFATYLFNGGKNTLEVGVKAGGKEYPLNVLTLNGDGWNDVDLDLNDYIGQTVQIYWRNTVMSHILTAIDNIRVTCVEKEGPAMLYLRGDFNEWGTLHPLTHIEDGVYELEGVADIMSGSFRISTEDGETIDLGADEAKTEIAVNEEFKLVAKGVHIVAPTVIPADTKMRLDLNASTLTLVSKDAGATPTIAPSTNEVPVIYTVTGQRIDRISAPGVYLLRYSDRTEKVVK